MSSEIYITIVALALCLGFGAFSYHMHTREHNELEPRMMPWSIIAMGCVATSFMLIVHLLNLFGMETGGRR